MAQAPTDADDANAEEARRIATAREARERNEILTNPRKSITTEQNPRFEIVADTVSRTRVHICTVTKKRVGAAWKSVGNKIYDHIVAGNGTKAECVAMMKDAYM